MKILLHILIIVLLLVSCKKEPKEHVNKSVLNLKKDTINLILKTDTIAETQPFMNAYIVVVDTSQNYYKLKNTMFKLSKKLKIKIDTLKRGYDKKNDFIGLVKSNNDGIYCDNYFQRRHNPTEFFSIEYLSYYTTSENKKNNTMALISYITPEQEKAERQFEIIKRHNPKVYILNTEIFMGCMQ